MSFDVVSLVTNVPITDACNAISNLLQSDPSLDQRTRLSPEEVVNLTKLCLTSTYFKWQGKFYEQQEGQVMGLPLSPVTSNIFMDNFETKAIESYHLKPLVWFRYVDDNFVVRQHGRDELDKFLGHLNSQHPAIQFTMELEHNGILPFLDVSVERSKDKLSFSVYRKPTHTDQYIHFSSSHYILAKNSVVNTLVHSALSICDETTHPDELKHIEHALGNNGYPTRLVRKAINKQSQRLDEVEIVEDNHKGVTFMPYIQGVTEKICRFLNRAGVKTYYSHSNKLRDILSNPKDPQPKDHGPCAYSFHVVVATST